MRIWTLAFVFLLIVLGLSRYSGLRMAYVVALAWALFFALASKDTQPPGRSAWAALILCLISGISALWCSLSNTRPVDDFFALFSGISISIGTCQLAVFLHRQHRPAQTLS
jgi:hypothetical protein